MHLADCSPDRYNNLTQSCYELRALIPQGGSHLLQIILYINRTKTLNTFAVSNNNSTVINLLLLFACFSFLSRHSLLCTCLPHREHLHVVFACVCDERCHREEPEAKDEGQGGGKEGSTAGSTAGLGREGLKK